MISLLSLPLIDTLLLFGTAFIAGGLNAVAGGGSFITFPTLIFTGVPPIAANATNNTALWVAAWASVGAYRKDFHIERRTLLILALTSLIGGTVGSIALLYTSPNVFKALIPYLLLLATLMFTFGDRIKALFYKWSKNSSSDSPPFFKVVLAQLAISIYGGFFGAGLGILMLATLVFLGIKNIHTMNAFKTFLGGCINGIAIVPFVFAGVIFWHQAILMAVVVIVVAFTMTAYFFIHG